MEGGNSPVRSTGKMLSLNYRLALFPLAMLHQLIPCAQDLLTHIGKESQTANCPGKMIKPDDTNVLLGAEELLEQSETFK